MDWSRLDLTVHKVQGATMCGWTLQREAASADCCREVVVKCTVAILQHGFDRGVDGR